MVSAGLSRTSSEDVGRKSTRQAIVPTLDESLLNDKPLTRKESELDAGVDEVDGTFSKRLLKVIFLGIAIISMMVVSMMVLLKVEADVKKDIVRANTKKVAFNETEYGLPESFESFLANSSSSNSTSSNNTFRFLTASDKVDYGYYKALEMSAKKNDIELLNLWYTFCPGCKWAGFTSKYDIVDRYLAGEFTSNSTDAADHIKDDDVIMFNDAFDVIVVEHKDVIMQKFLKMNAPIVFSQERVDTSKQVFGACELKNSKDLVMNSGNYIGYGKYMKVLYKFLMLSKELNSNSTSDARKQLINDFLYETASDDQVILNQLCNRDDIFPGIQDFYRKYIAVDAHQDIFWVIDGPAVMTSLSRYTSGDVGLLKTYAENNTDSTPMVLKKAGHNIDTKHSEGRQPSLIHLSFHTHAPDLVAHLYPESVGSEEWAISQPAWATSKSFRNQVITLAQRFIHNQLKTAFTTVSSRL